MTREEKINKASAALEQVGGMEGLYGDIPYRLDRIRELLDVIPYNRPNDITRLREHVDKAFDCLDDMSAYLTLISSFVRKLEDEE